jgi:acetylornithine deacetylase/succinyl-diaminopimelate desuccinylase-like protein
LWSTTSLRGNVVGELTVEVLTEGVHSGDASGVVASSFRVLRLLLDRLEDAETGGLLSDALYQPIPDQRIAQAERAATVMGTAIYDKFPLVDGMQPMHDNLTQLILNRTWRPTLSYTGIDGLPTIAQGGNVLRPQTAIKLSFRIPPTLDAAVAEAEIKRILESNPPYGARVRFESREPANGWEAPATATWLEAATDAASETYFGSPACAMGEGGSIPFMAMLGDQYPQAQFLITGVLGPHSNAHGPNEFLHIQCAKNVTCCVADILTKVPR